VALRIAAIGCGDIAQRRFFPQIEALGGSAELVAIAARNGERLRSCAARFGIPRTYTDAAAMVHDDGVDAVLVLTPPGSHADYAEMAIRAGKHVLVEKPMVTSLDEAARLRAAVRAQRSVKPVTFVALPNSNTAEHDFVAGLLRDAAVGTITSVECHRGHRGPTHAGWFYKKHLAGGGVLSDLGIYGLTSVATLFGPAARMTALCTRHFDTRTLDDGTIVEPDVEDSALLSLTLENRIAVSLNTNWNGCLSHHATRARTIVIGREGMLQFGVADGAVYVFRPDGDYRTLPPGSQEAAFDGYAGRRFSPQAMGAGRTLMEDFVAKIAEGDTSARTLDIQAHVLEIISKAYDAAAAGTAIALTSRF
jgi:1,5-anhydro-D-fructose reductase (1,5-anhydro-D-mannitol-forming)